MINITNITRYEGINASTAGYLYESHEFVSMPPHGVTTS